jgi:hypothetical protein
MKFALTSKDLIHNKTEAKLVSITQAQNFLEDVSEINAEDLNAGEQWNVEIGDFMLKTLMRLE